MIEFASFDELSFLKGSKPLIEKVELIQAFIRKNGMAYAIKPYPRIKIDFVEKSLSFDLSISIPLPSSQRFPFIDSFQGAT
jgi:hypothetical protein